MCKDLFLSLVFVCLMAGLASAAVTPTSFECDSVISGSGQTGADGTPWIINTYDTSIGWTASAGILTATGSNLGSTSDGSLIVRKNAWAANGSDGLAHRLDVRMAIAGCDYDSMGSTSNHISVKVPVSSTTIKFYYITYI